MNNIIIARTQQEAHDALRQYDLDPAHWLKVTHIHHVRALFGKVIDNDQDNIFVLGWPDNEYHAREIEKTLRARGWNGVEKTPVPRAEWPTADISAAVDEWRKAAIGRSARLRPQARLVVSTKTKEAMEALPVEEHARLVGDLTIVAFQFGLRVPVIFETYDNDVQA